MKKGSIRSWKETGQFFQAPAGSRFDPWRKFRIESTTWKTIPSEGFPAAAKVKSSTWLACHGLTKATFLPLRLAFADCRPDTGHYKHPTKVPMRKDHRHRSGGQQPLTAFGKLQLQLLKKHNEFVSDNQANKTWVTNDTNLMAAKMHLRCVSSNGPCRPASHTRMMKILQWAGWFLPASRWTLRYAKDERKASAWTLTWRWTARKVTTKKSSHSICLCLPVSFPAISECNASRLSSSRLPPSERSSSRRRSLWLPSAVWTLPQNPDQEAAWGVLVGVGFQEASLVLPVVLWFLKRKLNDWNNDEARKWWKKTFIGLQEWIPFFVNCSQCVSQIFAALWQISRRRWWGRGSLVHQTAPDAHVIVAVNNDATAAAFTAAWRRSGPCRQAQFASGIHRSSPVWCGPAVLLFPQFPEKLTDLVQLLSVVARRWRRKRRADVSSICFFLHKD